MKYRINKVKYKGDITYYLATSVRNGKRVSTKNIKPLGKYSELSKNYEDVDKYIKEQLDSYNEEFIERINLSFDPNNRIGKDDGGFLEAGSLFIKRIFNDIKLDKTLDDINSKYKTKFSLSDVIFFLIANRIIHPDSKIGMYHHALKHSLFDIKFTKDTIYRAMDILEDNKNEILKSCYDNLPYGIKRNRKVLYYDCTNTYFESEIEDNLRARGKGKRNEVEPLVSLGLVMDATGIPLTYTVFKGSTNEQKTLIPLEKEIAEEFRNANFVMITDAGLSSCDNRCFNSLGNRKYITTLAVRVMSEEKVNNYIFDNNKEWITPNSEYKTPADIKNKYNQLNANLKEAENDCVKAKAIDKEINELADIILYRRYPVKIDKKPVKYLDNPKADRKNPDKCFIDEDYIVSYSLKYELRQKHQRDKLVEKANKLLANPGRLTKNGPNDPKQYISKITSDSDTGEIIKETYGIDNDLIKQQEKLDGYYCVATNLTDDDNETIINAMRYRWFIEDSFRILKQYFDFRPVNHYKEIRIKSHFCTCFLSLLIYRYIQKMCHESKYDSLKHITDDNIISLLREYNLAIVKKDFRVPSFKLTQEVKDFEELFNVFLSREIMNQAIINKEIRKELRTK